MVELGSARTTKEMKRLENSRARLGQIVSGQYELLELLGHGGMGAVYKARHLAMDRIVAVKFLLPEIAEDPLMRQRFFREAEASGKLNHPNVIQLIDYGEVAADEAYIVVEFLDGIGLDQLLRAERRLEYTRAVGIFEQICAGVAKAHSRGILHRDLKPSNIMLVEEHGTCDFVKVVDFGLAKALDPADESQKLTQTGEVFGSPVYMSPEQCRGLELGPGSDIYAVGILMYETLMGKVPFLGSHVGQTIARHLQDTPKPFAEQRPDLEIPRDLEAVVMKALAKRPEERQQSMTELKDELADTMLPKLLPRKRRPTTELTAELNSNAASPRAGGAASGPGGSAAAGLPACKDGGHTVVMRDSSQPARDASQPARDASQPARDASQPVRDASQPVRDPSQPSPDASQLSRDRSQSARDRSQSARDRSQSARNSPSTAFRPLSSKPLLIALSALGLSGLLGLGIFLGTSIKRLESSAVGGVKQVQANDSTVPAQEAALPARSDSPASLKSLQSVEESQLSNSKLPKIPEVPKISHEADNSRSAERTVPRGAGLRGPKERLLSANEKHSGKLANEKHGVTANDRAKSRHLSNKHRKGAEKHVSNQEPEIPDIIETSHKHHHNWQDYSYGIEKKGRYASSWTVPIPGAD